MEPTVGRIVHYIWPNSGYHYAAIVTEAFLGQSVVSIAVLYPVIRATVFLEDVEHSEEKADGTWHWPERS
jgi:hypothetical protein